MKVSHRSKSDSKAHMVQHALALSLATAKQARNERIVRKFRKEVLKRRRLSPDEVQGWIEDQAARDRIRLESNQVPAYDQDVLYYAGPDGNEETARARFEGMPRTTVKGVHAQVPKGVRPRTSTSGT